MSNYKSYDDEHHELQARVAQAMRKAHRERAEAVARIFGGLWNALRHSFKSKAPKQAIINHEHRSLAGCN